MRPASHYQTETRRPDKSKSLSARTRAAFALFAVIIVALTASISLGWPGGGRVAAPAAHEAVGDTVSGFLSAALFQSASESIQTYAADCQTPKDVFTLGQTICVKADIPFVLIGRRNINIIGPSNVVRASVNVSGLSQTLTFTLPTTAQTVIGGETFDNRGTWRADLTTVSGARRASAYFDVSAPTPAADLQIVADIDGDDTVESGQSLSVSVYVFNMGPDPAMNVVVTPPTNSGLALQSFAPVSGTDCGATCTIASLARRGVAKFTAVYNVTAAAGTKFAALTSVTSATEDPHPSSNSDSIYLVVTAATNTGTCTLSCPANITVDSQPGLAGANVNYPDATGSSGCGELTTDRPEDPQTGTAFFPIGTTSVTITDGSDASCSFLVTVLDKRPVKITLNGPAEMTANCSTTFTDPGATATDGTSSVPVTTVVTVPTGAVDSNGDPVMVQVSGVNTSVPGDYTITYTATKDVDSATVTRVVHVVATSAPVITLAGTAGFTPQTVQITDTDDNGDPIVITETILVKTIECHSSFTAPTATAVSGCGGASIPVTTSGTVDANTPGVYEIIYGAVDTAGNDAETRVRVTVVDTTAPVITLSGASPLTWECHTTFVDPGATASDACDTSVPVNVSGTVNENVVGTFTLTYNATDASGNAAAPVTRTVNVVDTTAPVVTLNDAASVTVECHTSYTDAGASASDACDSTTPVTSTSDVNVNAPGTYHVVYTATDDSNNAGTATRTVVVVDTTPPVITTNGVTPSMWPANHKYKTFLVTDFVTGVSDSCNTSLAVSSVVIEKVTSDETENGNGDGNTLNDIVIAGDYKSVQLRAEREGGGNGRVYTITFRVRDASGNTTTAAGKVVVPHNPGETPIDSGVHYTVNGSYP